MKSTYSIILPIFNEISQLPTLIKKLKPYHNDGHEIIIIDDGSQDGSFEFLSSFNFIKLLRHKKNSGKGIALKTGIINSKHKKLVIFDGDLELDPIQIKKLMKLNLDKNIKCIFATRYNKINPFLSFWEFGNFLLTKLFNFINNAKTKDALCCAKAFFKSDLNHKSLQAKKFDIDVEIASKLLQVHNNVTTVKIDYHRRSKDDGKKLSIKDSFSIILQILKSSN